jgi:enoyl-CoA hydratase
MSDSSYVRTDRENEVAIVTIDRQDKMNALNPEVIGQLGEAFEALRDDDEIRGVILTGAGDKAFVAGADIGELAKMDALSGVDVSRQGQGVLAAIEGFPKPVLAAVGGYALGGGCELALACHLRVASENARFGLPEVGLGIIPGYGGTVRLARIVGLGRALEMTLTGEMVGAEQAFGMGLVSAVVPREDLLQEARERMAKITKNGPVAVRMALESVYHALGASMAEALGYEAKLFGLLAATHDMKEGMSAFLEKRKPEFEGR